MTEREQAIERLMAFPLHMERERAERHVRDDDLWLIEPELREGLEGEAAVRSWRQAVGFAEAFAEGFTLSMNSPAGEATVHLLWDMHRRALEALRRAEERAAKGQEAGCKAH
jgi:hypothetical protein